MDIDLGGNQMLASIKGMFVTLKSTFKRPVTDEYPTKRRPVEPRYMGFPALTWDYGVSEPFAQRAWCAFVIVLLNA